MLSFSKSLMKFTDSFFKRKVCYSAIDIGTFQDMSSNFRAQYPASPGRGVNLGSPDKVP